MADEFDKIDNKRRARVQQTQLTDEDRQQMQQGAHLRPERPTASVPRPSEGQLLDALSKGNFEGLDLRGDFSQYPALNHLKDENGQVTARSLITPEAILKHEAHQAQARPYANDRQVNSAVNAKADQLSQSGINLKNANLSGTNLQNTIMHDRDYAINVDMSGANLSKANLSNSYMLYGKMDGANLQEANLQGANMVYGSMQNAKADKINMTGGNFQALNMDGSSLQQAKMNGAIMETASMEKTNLKGANFEGAKIGGARFQGANLEGANVQQALNHGSAHFTQSPPRPTVPPPVKAKTKKNWKDRALGK